MATLRGHSKEISDLDVNFENTILASASYDKKIRIWNIKTAENTEVLLEHIQVITYVKVIEIASCFGWLLYTEFWLKYFEKKVCYF